MEMSAYDHTLQLLRSEPRRWLVTGAGGFIGSNLVEALIRAGQSVVGVDDFSTGRRENHQKVLDACGAGAGRQFKLLEGDLRSHDTCREACRDVDVVLHEAAQVSVPASLEDPVATHEINVTGFLNVLRAAREHKVRRVVYASSCAIYGDSTRLPLTEEQPARPLSPYAASKLANEAYAASFSQSYGMETVGLRYFNVFGPRQDPNGAYAAVIPLWTAAMIQNKPVRIFGDGSTTRDFCHVANVVQANLLAATAPLAASPHEVFNVAVNDRTSLGELFEMLRVALLPDFPHLKSFRAIHEDFRPGDIRHSQADISKAHRLLGYAPTHSVARGLQETLAWYKNTPP
jgi:UDP-N-acetylglucosamine 4-epimerase